MKQVWSILMQWIKLPVSDRTLVLAAVMILLFTFTTSYFFKKHEQVSNELKAENKTLKFQNDSLKLELFSQKQSNLLLELRRADSLLREANRLRDENRIQLDRVLKATKK